MKKKHFNYTNSNSWVMMDSFITKHRVNTKGIQNQAYQILRDSYAAVEQSNMQCQEWLMYNMLNKQIRRLRNLKVQRF